MSSELWARDEHPWPDGTVFRHHLESLDPSTIHHSWSQCDLHLQASPAHELLPGHLHADAPKDFMNCIPVAAFLRPGGSWIAQMGFVGLEPKTPARAANSH